MEKTEKTKPETTKIDGISAQINLSPGSETHRRFAQHMKESGATTARAFIELLLDLYEHPHVETDNSEAIERLQNQAKKLSEEVTESHNLIEKQDQEIVDLKEQLEAAQKEANANAEKGLGQELQLSEMKMRLQGAILIENPNPVAKFFLDEMAAKRNKEPGKILLQLFMDDLQNPRSNNLPYDVPGYRVRDVMEKLKQLQQQQNTPDNGQQQQQ